MSRVERLIGLVLLAAVRAALGMRNAWQDRQSRRYAR